MVWYGMVWYGMAWYSMACYGMVWYSMAWHGMAWRGETRAQHATMVILVLLIDTSLDRTRRVIGRQVPQGQAVHSQPATQGTRKRGRCLQNVTSTHRSGIGIYPLLRHNPTYSFGCSTVPVCFKFSLG